jgi:hypothetical protein
LAKLPLAVLLFLFAAPAHSQEFRFGAKLGVPITSYFETGSTGSLHGSAEYSAATRRYTLGPSVEWRWSNGLGFEGGALYHRMGYVAIVHSFDSATGAFHDSAVDIKGNSWDFPLMLKYRSRKPLHRYAAAGPLIRYLGPVRGRGEQTSGSLVTGVRITTPVDTSDPSELRKRVYPGFTAAAGFEWTVHRVHLLPELRYTRWTANISGPGGLLRFAPNQLEFLLGALF